MKYSKNFERDYNWYLKYYDHFAFSGTANPRYVAYKEEDPTIQPNLSVKECFYKIESGIPIGYKKKNDYGETITYVACENPELLSSIILCKAGINFAIKQWIEGIMDGGYAARTCMRNIPFNILPLKHTSMFSLYGTIRTAACPLKKRENGASCWI